MVTTTINSIYDENIRVVSTEKHLTPPPLPQINTAMVSPSPWSSGQSAVDLALGRGALNTEVEKEVRKSARRSSAYTQNKIICLYQRHCMVLCSFCPLCRPLG